MTTTFGTLGELRAATGTSLGPSREFEIGQSRITAFVSTTEDRQWIHLDSRRATTGPYGTTIAHGLLTLSLVPAILEDLVRIEDVAMAINYGFNRVRFPSPVLAGSVLRGSLEIAAVDEVPGGCQAQFDVVIAVPGAQKPACAAQIIVRYVVAPDRDDQTD